MRKPLILTALLAVLFAGPALAMDLDDVIRMLEANVGEDVILKAIDAEHASFVITSEDLIDLKDAGASDWLLDQLLDRADEPPRAVDRSYRVVEPSYSLITLGWVYDPFDYYFVHWPYYYAYVSPFRFSYSWWYYGGPLHTTWCDPWGWRVHYYDRYWGTRTIWDRGYRGGARYHVPRYDAADKAGGREIYGRTAGYVRPSRDADRTRSWDRRTTGARPERPAVSDRGTRNGRPTRSPAWGRPARRDRGVAPPRAPRTEIRSQRPERSVAPPARAPRQGYSRPQPSSRPSAPAPARSGSSPGRSASSPARPTGERHGWSR